MSYESDRVMDLYRKLAQAAISWTLAERIMNDHALTVANLVKLREVDDSPAVKERCGLAVAALATARKREADLAYELQVMARKLTVELEK